MRKSKTLYPAEEWLARNWIGDSYKNFPIDQLVYKTKDKVFKYIYQELIISGQKKPPFNPYKLLPTRKIIKITESKNLPKYYEGILDPIEGGFQLKINKTLSYHRKRFTVAHEIGHTFFYDLNLREPRKNFITSKAQKMVEEDYANSFAVEILMPKPSLEKRLLKASILPSIESIIRLQEIYNVSFDVIARQVIRNLQLWDCLYFEAVCLDDKIFRSNRSSICKGPSFQTKYWTVTKDFFMKNDKLWIDLIYYLVIDMIKDVNQRTIKDKEIIYRGNRYIIEVIKKYRFDSSTYAILIHL